MVGGEGIKMASANTLLANELAQRPHFSPHSITKTNDKSTNLKNGI